MDNSNLLFGMLLKHLPFQHFLFFLFGIGLSIFCSLSYTDHGYALTHIQFSIGAMFAWCCFLEAIQFSVNQRFTYHLPSFIHFSDAWDGGAGKIPVFNSTPHCPFRLLKYFIMWCYWNKVNSGWTKVPLLNACVASSQWNSTSVFSFALSHNIT